MDYSELFKEFEPDTVDGDEVIESPDEPTTPEEPEPVSDIPLVNELKSDKYSYVPIADLEWAYEKALHTYLSHVFPFNYNVVDIPEDRPRDKVWVKRCMIEILAMNDIMGDMPLRSYSENEMSYTFDENMLSKSLIDTLPPPIAVVRGSRK